MEIILEILDAKLICMQFLGNLCHCRRGVYVYVGAVPNMSAPWALFP